MTYEVRYDPKAEKQLEKLPKEIASRIVRKLGEVAQTGRGIESINDKEYGHKIRVGDYRAIVDVERNPDIIWVRVVGHRSTIYKRI